MSTPKVQTGLTTAEAELSRQKHGSNTLELQEDRVLLNVLKEVVLEPMFILLLAACIIYFVVGQYQEGIIMLISIFIVAGISLFQEYRSKNAVQALKKLSAPHAKIIRNGNVVQIATEEIVVDDILLIEEGEIVAADGVILAANDFSLNESVLTGESFAVNKTAEEKHSVYKGTLVTSGSATIKVEAVGLKTMFGKIGLSMKEIRIEKTPLGVIMVGPYLLQYAFAFSVSCGSFADRFLESAVLTETAGFFGLPPVGIKLCAVIKFRSPAKPSATQGT